MLNEQTEALSILPTQAEPDHGEALGEAFRTWLRNLSLSAIEAVVAYLPARIVGHEKITPEKCLTCYEGKKDCNDLK
jgi:hypothetical protein